jgi:hypothetical protein
MKKIGELDMVKKSLIISLAVIVPLLFFVGCAEDEQPVAPVSSLTLKLVAGPEGEVPFNAYVTYQWQVIGGSGDYTNYSYSLTRNGAAFETGSAASMNNVRFTNLAVGSYTFTVTVTDSKNATAQDTRSMTVVSSSAVPVVSITSSPVAGGKVAEYKSVSFTWTGDDPEADFGTITGYTFKLMRDTTMVGGSDVQTYDNSVAFDSVLTGEHTFYVNAFNNAGMMASDSVKFSVIPANVLWIDDYYQGGIPAEFVEYQEKVVELNGYAWTEFDIHDNMDGDFSTMAPLDEIINGPGSNIKAVIWDAETTFGPYELYFATNGGGDLLGPFLDNGGNLVIIGNEIQDLIYDNYPPLAGEWEVVYQGISTEELMVVTSDTTDTLITDPGTGALIPGIIVTFDTTYYDPYEYYGFVYGAADPLKGLEGYPDLTVDIGKIDPSESEGYAYWNISPDAKVIAETSDGIVACYIYQPVGRTGKVVTIGIPLYFSPTANYTDLIQKVLGEEFGL